MFKEFLQKSPFSSINFENDIIPRIKDLMIDSFLATNSDLNQNKRKHCFELLGYDFLIDEDFRVWLIEVSLIR